MIQVLTDTYNYKIKIVTVNLIGVNAASIHIFEILQIYFYFRSSDVFSPCISSYILQRRNIIQTSKCSAPLVVVRFYFSH